MCSQSELSILNEVDLDFRISGLPHSIVKQAENFRVRELVRKIESHPHRQALLVDLQQSNAYNPFSEKSKKMIKDMGNIELFELFETDPKTQCKECLLHWSQGIVYCTCGHLLKESEASRGAIQCTLDLLTCKSFVILGFCFRLCVSVSVSLSLSAGRARQSPRRDSLSPCA